MATPEDTSGQSDHPDHQHGQRIEPIDPTLTFDSHSRQKATSSAHPDGSTAETTEFEPNEANDSVSYTKVGYSGPTDPEPDTDPKPSFTKVGYPNPTDSASTSTQSTDSDFSETDSPARYYPPTQAPPTPVTDTRPPPTEEELGPRAIRMRTVVFGLVLLVIAGAVLVGQITDVTVNAGAILLALMIGGGLLLIAGARRA